MGRRLDNSEEYIFYTVSVFCYNKVPMASQKTMGFAAHLEERMSEAVMQLLWMVVSGIRGSQGERWGRE